MPLRVPDARRWLGLHPAAVSGSMKGQPRYCIAARPHSRSLRTLCGRTRDRSESWFDTPADVGRNRASGHRFPVCVECEAVAKPGAVG